MLNIFNNNCWTEELC